MIRTEARTRTSDALAHQLDELIESASELLDSLNDQRGEAVETLRSRAHRNIDSARERLATLKPQVMDSGARAIDTGTRVARTAVEAARRNPWATVAVGTAVVASLAALLYASFSDDR